jgi:hypothetical protein
MLQFIRNNSQFVIMCLAWVLCGIINQNLGVAAVTLSVVMLKMKGMYKELILGLLFLLIMSDSRQTEALYAATAKNIYIVLLSVFYFFDRKNFSGSNDYFKPFIPFFYLGWTHAFASTFGKFHQQCHENIKLCASFYCCSGLFPQTIS